MEGIIENVQVAHGFIRDLEQWNRWFFSRDDLVDGLAEPAATVEFQPDTESDTRGPRACQVRVTAPPEPDIDCRCRGCGASFAVTATTRAWFAVKGLPVPVRCESCRAARRAARER